MYSDPITMEAPSRTQNLVPSPIIDVQGVSKIYRSYSKPSDRLREFFARGSQRFSRETRALDNVSLQLPAGSRLGILGENGSGKSTLLKLLCGVLTPSSGSVRVQGRISALLELGAGFNPHLTGRENIRQFCMLHGMERDAIDAALPEILRFSELHEAIDQPIKTYSSGMAVRLGFSCAVYSQPDILIVDEALSVGDSYFQNKCVHKIKSLLDEGVTFLYVTHSADGIRSLCDQGLWLDHGQVRMTGSSREVGSAYQTEVFKRMAAAGIERKHYLPQANQAQSTQSLETAQRFQAFATRVAPLRAGSGEIRMQYIALLDEQGQETDSLAFGSRVRVRIHYQVLHPIDGEQAITLGVADNTGKQLMHFNTASEQIFLPTDALGQARHVDFDFLCPLGPGEYGLMAGVGSFVENPMLPGQLMVGEVVDHCSGGNRFSIRYPEEPLNVWGVVYAPCAMSDQASS